MSRAKHIRLYLFVILLIMNILPLFSQTPNTLINDSIARIEFEPCAKQNYGFDAYTKGKQHIFYQHLPTQTGKTYHVPWKSIGSGKTDYVDVKLKYLFNGFSRKNLHFETSDGEPVKYKIINSEAIYKLELKGLEARSKKGKTYSVLAYYKQKGKKYLVGKLNIKSYNQIKKNIAIVPVNGAGVDIKGLEKYINSVFKQAVAKIKITEIPLTIPWDSMDLNALTEFEAHQQRLELYKRHLNKNITDSIQADYVLFLFEPDPLKPNERTTLNAITYENQPYGIFYLKKGSKEKVFRDLTQTAAHGCSKLKHTWEMGVGSQDGTDNLMDYGGGTDLYVYQWQNIHDPAGGLGWFQDVEQGKAYGGPGTDFLCIDDGVALDKVNKHRVFHLADGRVLDLTGTDYKVSGFYTANDPLKTAQGGLYALKIDGFDYQQVYKDNQTKGFGYIDAQNKVMRTVAIEDLTVQDKNENAVRVFIDKTNNKIEIKKGGAVVEEIPISTGCNCTYPGQFTGLYFAAANSSKAYLAYFTKNNKKISHSIAGETGIVDQLVEQVKAGKGHSNKDISFLGEILADKLRTYELFNSGRKFIVAPLLVDALSTNQQAWQALAEKVFQQAGLSANDILVTIPYVHCQGIGFDQGDYFFMPGLAFGGNIQIEFPKLGAKYINTQNTAAIESGQALALNKFILDIFTHTTKRSLIYKGIFLANNSVECLLFEKSAATGHAFNKTVQFYRQQGYTGLADLIKKGNERYIAADQGMKEKMSTPGAFNVALYNKTLNKIKLQNRLDRLNKIEGLAQETGLEWYEPTGSTVHFKEEFLDAENPESGMGQDMAINAVSYILSVPFDPLRKELGYEESAGFDWEPSHAFTSKAEYVLQRVDDKVYTGLDIVSIALGAILPGTDVVPDALGLLYSMGRLKFSYAGTYTLAVIIPSAMGNSATLKATLGKLEKNIFRVAKQGQAGVIESAADDVLLEIVESAYKNKNITEETYNALKAKEGSQLKQGVEEFLGMPVTIKIMDNFAGIGAKNGNKILKSANGTWIAEVLESEKKIIVNVDEIATSTTVLGKADDVTIVYRSGNTDLFEDVGTVAVGKQGADNCIVGDKLCFAAGTIVNTPKGRINIEDIKKGDIVYSRKHSTDKTVKKGIVKQTMRSITHQLTRIIIASQLLLATPNHPFYANGNWKDAGELQQGDTLLTIDNQKILIDRIETFDTTATTYNFEVEDLHTYYVGGLGFWVHNECWWETFKSNLGDKYGDFRNASISGNITSAQRKAIFKKISDMDPDLARQFADDIINSVAANQKFVDDIFANENLLKAWEVVSSGTETLRKNTDNLEKLAKFMDETGMEQSKLISNFKNAKSPQKWIDMKIPETELDAIYDGFKNSPPPKLDAWTPEHKAQRWANYKTGNPDADFKNWSNTYDGNIDKAIAANKSVDDFFATLGGNAVREKNFPNLTINTENGVETFSRRLDIVDEDIAKGIEFKEYSSGKVYRSPDVKREYALDEKLLKDETLDEIEWIFKGCEPSAPLRTDLEDIGITITLLP